MPDLKARSLTHQIRSGRSVTGIFVDGPNCTSCGLCAETHPQYFRMNEYDLAESHNGGDNVNLASVQTDDLQSLQVAIEDCPGECIYWKTSEDAGTDVGGSREAAEVISK